MSALNNYNYKKLLHDIKRIGEGVQIIQDEENPKKRKLIADLLRGEIDRLYSDIEEMKAEDTNAKKKENK